MMKSMYFRVPEGVHDAVQEISSRTGLPVSTVGSYLLCKALGRAFTVEAAIDQVQREGRPDDVRRD